MERKPKRLSDDATELKRKKAEEVGGASGTRICNLFYFTISTVVNYWIFLSKVMRWLGLVFLSLSVCFIFIKIESIEGGFFIFVSKSK